MTSEPPQRLKATPIFEKSVAASGAIIFTVLALLTVDEISWYGLLSIGIILAIGCLVWLPVSLLIALSNRPKIEVTSQGIAVQPDNTGVKPRVIPFKKCRWCLDDDDRLILRLFPLYYSVTKLGAFPHRLVLELDDAERERWVQRLREEGAPEDYR